MKTKRLDVNWIDCEWQFEFRDLRAESGLGNYQGPPHHAAMPQSFRQQCAFTLIELLVVIAIIAILAGLLLPALATVKQRAKVTQAKSEMKNLEIAIKAYETEYHRFPASKNAEDASSAAGSTGDFTYGTKGFSPPLPPIEVSAYAVNNAELMQILMDFDRGPGSPNEGHKRNPRHHAFFTAKMVPNGPGLSTVDDVLRDPWGNPYIVTIDMNGDDKCFDSFYVTMLNNNPNYQTQLAKAGLSTTNSLTGTVMIWSLGPDGQATANIGAMEGANKDNILGWQ